MFSVGATPRQGTVETIITSGRGLNPDELTRMAMPKLVYIGPDVPEDMRRQAEEGQKRMEMVLKHYFAQAQKSQNTTIYNVLLNAGYADAAELVRSL